MIIFRTLFAIGEWHPEKVYWPRTLVDSSAAAVQTVRDRVLIPPYSSVYAQITAHADLSYDTYEVQREKASICRAAAFIFFVESDNTYGDKAREYLLDISREAYSSLDERYNNIIWDAEIIGLVTLAYDFLKGNNYDFGDDEPAVRDEIEGITSSLYYDLVVASPSYVPPNLKLLWELGEGEKTNYGVKFASAVGLAAIVLNDNSSSSSSHQPRQWIDYAMNKLHRHFGLWLVDNDGGWAEGPHYQRFSAANYIPFAIAHHNFVNGEAEEYNGTVYPPLTGNPDFNANAEWGVKIRQPNGARPDIDDSYRNSWFYNGYLASHLDNPLLAWDYQVSNRPYYHDSSTHNMDVEMICCFDTEYPYTAPDFTTIFLPEAGQAVFRSGWEDEAVYMCLLAENGLARTGGDSHEHPDNMSFVIYALGELLAMDSGYISWAERDRVRFAENHSLILVDGQGPPASDLMGSNGTDAFLENYFATGSFDYTEVTTSYQNTFFRRCAAFLQNQIFLFTDYLDAVSGHTYDWLLHGNGGGDSGHGFTLLSTGAEYEVNDVKLKLFISSTQDITLSSYDDYNDVGIFNEYGTHAVTKATIDGTDEIFTAFLLPDSADTQYEFTPVSNSIYCGGTLEFGETDILHLAQKHDFSIPFDFCGTPVNFDSDILIISRQAEQLPDNIFLQNGQILTYAGTGLINSSVDNIINLNIAETSADGYIRSAGQVDLFTGNCPAEVSGVIDWSFAAGVTSLICSDSASFQLEVAWVLYYPQVVGLTLQIQGNNVVLNWQGEGSIFHVYRSTSPDSGFVEIGQTSSFNFTDISGAAHQRFFYQVTAE